MRRSIPGRLALVLLVGSSLAVACGASSSAPPAPQAQAAAVVPGVEQYTYQIVRSHPHDPASFTQGLTIADGQVYEGTGLHGESSLRRVDLQTGAALQRIALDSRYFGEGIAVVGDRIVQLTYQTGVGFVYDRKTFATLKEFTYKGEGWGLTYDGQRLIMSDGTDTLRFWHPETLEEVGRLRVRDGDTAIERINELEFVDGAIYANIWQEERIARIDPATGVVTAWIDMSNLLTATERSRGVDVLNGIAHDPKTGHFLITGKLWPWVFEVRFVKKG
ncbi:glutaminyl-peptide cyclotransferase [Luteitalea sp.]|uniref:glutaminyl-peptide cyclotransferase n=1 Tax=Luteitalea sp. TaxID=2004800 RepID=UPI000A5A19F5|nr:glutaminyl-peptide cyclotransferase [Luteitalea sp.]